MKHEKIFKKGVVDYKLEVSIFIPNSWERLPHRYDLMLSVRENGKRKFHHIPSSEEIILEYLTSEEILEAKLELWEKLKP